MPEIISCDLPCGTAPAPRAAETTPPSDPFKVFKAVCLGRKPIHEFLKRLWVRVLLRCFHVEKYTKLRLLESISHPVLLIMNPGCLNPALRPGDLFKRHASYPNNPRIAEPFFFAKYIEKLGSGITDLIDACRATGLGDPEFDFSPGAFSIVIHRRNGTNGITLPEKLPERRRLIIDRMKVMPRVTIFELMIELGVSQTAVKNNIAWLKNHGYIRRVGGDKGGHWEVIGGE